MLTASGRRRSPSWRHWHSHTACQATASWGPTITREGCRRHNRRGYGRLRQVSTPPLTPSPLSPATTNFFRAQFAAQSPNGRNLDIMVRRRVDRRPLLIEPLMSAAGMVKNNATSTALFVRRAAHMTRSLPIMLHALDDTRDTMERSSCLIYSNFILICSIFWSIFCLIVKIRNSY